jgi:hypothetical protein
MPGSVFVSILIRIALQEQWHMDIKSTANLFLLVALVAWVLSLVIGFFMGQINWSLSLIILAFLLAAWLLHINANYEKKG